jgi:hypothetical protein
MVDDIMSMFLGDGLFDLFIGNVFVFRGIVDWKVVFLGRGENTFLIGYSYF